MAPESRQDLAFAGGRAFADDGIFGLPLATEEPKIGDKLLIVGNPYTRSQEGYQSIVTVTDKGTYNEVNRRNKLSVPSRVFRAFGTVVGKVMGLSFVDKGCAVSQVYGYTGDTAAGNSGSPVVNTKGEVVGVHYAGEALYLFAGERQGVCVTLPDLRAELERTGLHTRMNKPQTYR